MTSTGRRARVALIVKRSTYAAAQERPDDPLHRLLRAHDPTVANVLGAHKEHEATVAEVSKALDAAGVEVARVGRNREAFDASTFELVITVGGDGTLLQASHSVGTTPVLAINSAPSYSVGFFCGARTGGVTKALAAALAGKLARVHLTRMQVAVDGVLVHSRVLNDALYCHQSPAATSRYIVEHNGAIEEHKSSGIWIGPAAGSTAAQRSAGGKVLPLGSRSLQMVVREPYTPDGRAYQLARVLVKNGRVLRIRTKASRMRLFLDGPDRTINLTVGQVLDFTQSSEPLDLLGISKRRKWGVPRDQPGNG
jgi:NAD+ kinase